MAPSPIIPTFLILISGLIDGKKVRLVSSRISTSMESLFRTVYKESRVPPRVILFRFVLRVLQRYEYLSSRLIYEWSVVEKVCGSVLYRWNIKFDLCVRMEYLE